jgi:hypothetical protein
MAAPGERPADWGFELVNKRLEFFSQFLWKKLENLKKKLDTGCQTFYKWFKIQIKAYSSRGGDGKPRVFFKDGKIAGLPGKGCPDFLNLALAGKRYKGGMARGRVILTWLGLQHMSPTTLRIKSANRTRRSQRCTRQELTLQGGGLFWL